MRSVPFLFGNDIRHLRYTFGAVEDIDALVPGGFMSIFGREADIGIAHLLLWAGLQHEQIGYEDVGYYLISSNAVRDDSVLLDIFGKVTLALTNDEWISVEQRDPDDERERKTIAEIIQDVERVAASDLNLKPSELYGITPREFNLMREQYGLRDNFRAGLICATMANIHCRKQSGPEFEPQDFIRCGERAVSRSQTPEQQAAIMRGMFGG